MNTELNHNLDLMKLYLNCYNIKYKESSFYYYLDGNIPNNILTYKGESGWLFNNEDIRYNITSNYNPDGLPRSQCRYLPREDLKSNGLLKRLKTIAKDQRREEAFKKYCVLKCSGFINDINLLIIKFMLI